MAILAYGFFALFVLYFSWFYGMIICACIKSAKERKNE